MADSKISALTNKATPIGADSTVIVDSVALDNKKITLDSLPISSATQTALNGKENSLGFTPENVANKATDFSTINDTKYPSVEAVHEYTLAFQGTGIKTGGVLSIGTGGAGVATTFTVAAGTGQVVDNTVSPFTVTQVSWSQKTDVALTYLGTNSITFIAIDSSGNVVQSTTPFTPVQKRTYIEIGLVSHPTFTTVSAVNQAHCVAYNPINQFEDLATAIGFFNISGNVYAANGANLKLNKSAGETFNHGSNYSSLTNNPHVVTHASLTQATFRMVNQSGASGASTTDVDVDNYDVGGVTTAMSVNKYTIHRVFLFSSNLSAIQRGQTQYNSLAEAKAAIQTETFVSNAGLANALLRAYLIVKKGTTALNNTADAFLLEAPKFGGSAGVGGLAVSTLQDAYNNATDPEILTDSTRGAFTVKRGSAADTDNIWEGQNGSGTVTSYIKGNGEAQLDGFQFSTNTTAPNGTIPVEVLQVAGSATDIDLALVIKGNGAILAQVPDNGTGGGNKRGTQAVDFQMSRSANAQVASGANSFAAGARNTTSGQYGAALGFSNTASGQASVALGSTNTANAAQSVALGFSNTASGSYSVALGYAVTAAGTGALATGYQAATSTTQGRHSHSSGQLAAAGDSQYSMWDLKRSTTDNTATALTMGGITPGSTSRVQIPNNTAYAFTGVIVGKQSGSANCVAWEFKGLIVRGANAASTAIVGTPTITAIDNTAAWGTPTLAADTTNGALTVSVVGAAATNIRWTCTLRTTEITYA